MALVEFIHTAAYVLILGAIIRVIQANFPESGASRALGLLYG